VGRRIFVIQIVAIALMVLLLSAGYHWQRAVRALDTRQHASRVPHLLFDGRVWYIWALASPSIMWLIRSTSLSRDRWLRSTLRLIGFSLVIYLSVTNARYLMRILTNTWPTSEVPGPSWTNYLRNQTFVLPLDLLSYCGFFAASFAIDSYFKYRQRAEEVFRLQLKAAELQAELTRAQLSSLQGQLQPHFLFNAFNAISMLVRQGETKFAVDMIARMGELLRLAMDTSSGVEQSLEREFHFSRCYLEVEQVRFSDKLRTRIELSADARRCLVPNLLLQPLVENAVKHGISRRTTPGMVHLVGERRGDRLHVEVMNDGPGSAPHSGQVNSGIGLRNTRSRLDLAYGSDYRLDIESLPTGGTSVRLDLPWRVYPKLEPVR
jgi:two-component sensor histidine kinase